MVSFTPALIPRGDSSWFSTAETVMPLARSFCRYSSIRSGGTSKATWFMEACAVRMSSGLPGPSPTTWRGEATPGAARGASGNQKKASASPLPMSKKKCWPAPSGSSIVFTSGMPRTFE